MELLRSYHPSLILADVQLPGMDGLELTRRVKQSRSHRDILVVALTAFAGKGDEQKAIDAGCDGYITKPIDTRALGSRIREILDRRLEAPPPATAPAGDSGQAPAIPGVDPAEMMVLRRRFLAEGQEKSRQLLLEMDGQFNANDAAKSVHQWIGTGGLLGYTAISRLAREVEAALFERPVDNSQLRDSLTNLALAFNSPREARDAPISDQIVKTLSGKRVVAVGFPANEAQRLNVALERARASVVFVDFSEPPNSRRALDCQLAAVHVGAETTGSRWLDPAHARADRPMVFVGARDDLLSLDHTIQSLAREFLMDAWQPEEALVRLSLALSPRPEGAPQAASQPGAPRGLSTPPPAGARPGADRRRRSHGVDAGADRAPELRHGVSYGFGRPGSPRGSSPPEAGGRGPRREHARHGWLRSAGGHARRGDPLAGYAADRAPAGERRDSRLHPGGGRLRGQTLQPHGARGAAEAASRAMTGIEFRVAAYLYCGYALLLVATFVMAVRRGYASRRLTRVSGLLRPQIRDALVDYLAGNHDLTRLKSFVRTSWADTSETLLGLQSTVGGSALDQLCELTLDLALAHEWCQQARSKDTTVRRSRLSAPGLYLRLRALPAGGRRTSGGCARRPRSRGAAGGLARPVENRRNPRCGARLRTGRFAQPHDPRPANRGPAPARHPVVRGARSPKSSNPGISPAFWRRSTF